MNEKISFNKEVKSTNTEFSKPYLLLYLLQWTKINRNRTTTDELSNAKEKKLWVVNFVTI